MPEEGGAGAALREGGGGEVRPWRGSVRHRPPVQPNWYTVL